MTINCNGKLIDLKIPKVMGIVNLTPDSFYDGGRFGSAQALLDRVGQMVADGADFIDVGGYSSRPGASFVTEDEELDRVVPAVTEIIKHFPNVRISVDTFRSKIAKESVRRGAVMINDISAGGLDRDMMETVAALRVPYIMMHMRGNPQTMQSLTDYSDIVSEMLFYFSQKIREARTFGISDLIIDPGFGFAKTLEQNYQILQKLDLFSMTGLPMLIGISRKSMIHKPLNSNAANALNGTTALHAVALMKGASILRVHDVKEAVETVKLVQLASVSGDDTARSAKL